MVIESNDLNSDSKEKREIAEKIKSDIRNLEKELERIQEDCLHLEYEIKNCQNSTSGFNLKRVCKKCTKEIGFPSQEEVKAWAEN
jgi:predicted RNase H-like nuclease (RuvC/YqgF family)